jgi:hypothetical protein
MTGAHLHRGEVEAAAVVVVVLRFEVVVVVVAAEEEEEELHHSEVAVVAEAAEAVEVKSQNHLLGEEAAVQKEAPFFQAEAEAVQVQPDGPRGAEVAEVARAGRLR